MHCYVLYKLTFDIIALHVYMSIFIYIHVAGGVMELQNQQHEPLPTGRMVDGRWAASSPWWSEEEDYSTPHRRTPVHNDLEP